MDSQAMLDDLKTLAQTLVVQGPYKQELRSRRVRVLYQNSTCIFDTTSVLLVWEQKQSDAPRYYLLEKALSRAKEAVLGDAGGCLILRLYLPGIESEQKFVQQQPNAIRFDKGPLAGYIRLNVESFTWLEEDDPLFGYPIDPYKQLDTRRSSRRVEVELAGVVLADSPSGVHLDEKAYRTRYYLPWGSINWQYLKASDTTTYCPYKGTANYFDVVIEGKIYKDLVWWYKSTLPDCVKIEKMICFYNEKVDITLDGQRLPKG